jgi:hypothetical protein
MSLDNESPEFLQLYDDINNYIIRSMKKAYPKLFKDKKVLDFAILNDFEKHPELALHQLKQLSFVLLRMKNQFLNSVYNI